MPGNRLFLQLSLVLSLALGLQMESQEQEKKTEIEWFGYMGAEFRYFHDNPLYTNQKNTYFSSVFKPQAFIDFKNDKDQLIFMGFARLDQYDAQRTHWDIRDVYWRHSFNSFELNVGVKTVSWGKTESNNLVDIVNQFDLLEGRSLEHKLGQPLIQLVYAPSWGVFEMYLMTYHRQLKFPGENGRLRPEFKISYNNTKYENKNAEYLPDVAVRFSKYINNFDFAISNFYGTAKLPLFFKNQNNEIVPYYQQINQTGIEAQWLLGAYAVKMEAINIFTKHNNKLAITLGGEYNISIPSGADLRVLAEYTYDQRGDQQINGLNNDLFVGLNFNNNDIRGTMFMASIVMDLDYGTMLLNLTGERRLSEDWKFSLSYNGIFNDNNNDFYYVIRKDSFLEIALYHYF